MIIVKVTPMLSKLLYAFILLISLFPLKNISIGFFGNLITYSDVLLVLILIVLLPLFFKKTRSTPSANQTVKLFYFIVFYALLSTLWTPFNGISYWYVFYQIFLAFLTISIPFLFSKITNDKHINYHGLVSNFATVLSFVFFMYLFFMQNSPNQRLSGYIGSAAIITVIMVPTLAVHLYNILHKKRLFLSMVCFLSSLLALILTQSRGGLVMLLLYLGITLLRKPSLKRILVMVILIGLFLIGFSDNISTERYTNMFQDNARSIAFDTTVAWWLDSPVSFIFGNGYGSLWQWAAYQNNAIPGWSDQWMFTEKGPILYHSHSLINQLIGELGIIGLLPFLIIIYILFKETWNSWKNKNEIKLNIFIALICTLPTFHLDLMIFRNWGVSIVWLFFFFTALRYTPINAIEKNSDSESTAR